jgi:hypothetical protein
MRTDHADPPIPARRETGLPAGELGDRLLATMYVRMWELVSGRSLPRDVPPDQLTKEELIRFWADDLYPCRASGRHAASLHSAAGGRR